MIDGNEDCVTKLKLTKLSKYNDRSRVTAKQTNRFRNTEAGKQLGRKTKLHTNRHTSGLAVDIHTSTANKVQSMVNYCQYLAFDHPYLSYNDHCNQWLFQEIFFIIFIIS